jgi:hypothetical protein
MKKHTHFWGAAISMSALVLLGSAPTSPSLPTTTAFIAAGGGAGSFSSVRAFTRILGADATQSELAKLRATFGGPRVDQFVRVFDYTVADGWKLAGSDDVKMPPPSGDTGNALVLDMIKAGTGPPNQTFRITTMMDALLTPQVHAQVGNDIASHYGSDAIGDFESVGNQLFYDLAQSLGDNSVALPNTVR